MKRILSVTVFVFTLCLISCQSDLMEDDNLNDVNLLIPIDIPDNGSSDCSEIRYAAVWIRNNNPSCGNNVSGYVASNTTVNYDRKITVMYTFLDDKDNPFPYIIDQKRYTILANSRVSQPIPILQNSGIASNGGDVINQITLVQNANGSSETCYEAPDTFFEYYNCFEKKEENKAQKILEKLWYKLN